MPFRKSSNNIIVVSLKRTGCPDIMWRILRGGGLGGCHMSVSSAKNSHLRTGVDKGNRTVLLKQSIVIAGDGVDAMLFMPSALNVKVKEFNQERVNDGSNEDSLKVAKYLII
jgi:hypothetical protein